MTHNTTTPSGPEAPLSQLLGFEPEDYVSVATQGVKVARTISAPDLDFEYAVGLLDQQDTWIGAQPVKPSTGDRRAKFSDVACLRVLYADLDFKEGDEQELMAVIDALSGVLGQRPTSIVRSGGGLHPRWKLAKPIEPQDAKGALNRWKLTVMRVAEEVGVKPDSVFDLPRVLRLPGTVNEKYTPHAPVTVDFVSGDLVPMATVWSKLDHTNGRKAPTATSTVDREVAEEALAAPAIEKPELKQTVSERYVNAEIGKDLERLRALARDGWDGEPWHNTTRDIAYRLAKIAVSPETKHERHELFSRFFSATPRDDQGFDDELIERYWESGIERAEEDFAGGDTYEMAGSGDDLFAEEMDELLAGVRKSREPKLDIDMGDFESVVAPVSSAEDVRSADERYLALPRPLVPGFGGKAALRSQPIDDAPPRVLQRVDVLAEDISDLHDIEHDEYMHPHCPLCFPDNWRAQLYRWLVRNPGKDPATIRPPIGRMGPDEGYMTLGEAASIGEVEQLIDGYLPSGGVGVVRGRGSAGKTFLALDMALAICDPGRREWRVPLSAEDNEYGVVTDHGKVLFLAGESMIGVRDRMVAAVDYNGADAAAVDDGFFLRGRVPNFFTGGAEYDALIDWAVQHKPRLVVIDTLQKAAVGAETNSASDMSIIYGRLSELKEATDGGTVMLIAHTDKSDETSRGSSAIEDDADFVLHVKGERMDPRTVQVVKMRDGAPGPDYEFSINSHAGSAVALPVAEGVRDDRRFTENMIAVAQALEANHDITSRDDEIRMTEIVEMAQGLSRETVKRTMRLLVENHYIVYSGATRARTYRLTPQGRAWLEAQHLGVFQRKAQR